ARRLAAADVGHFDPEVGRARDEHAPHIAHALAAQLTEDGVVEDRVVRIPPDHGLGVALRECLIEAMDDAFVSNHALYPYHALTPLHPPPTSPPAGGRGHGHAPAGPSPNTRAPRGTRGERSALIARARTTSRAATAGWSPFKCGSSTNTEVASSATVRPGNGISPAMASNTITPSEKTSDCASASLPRNCSGAM